MAENKKKNNNKEKENAEFIDNNISFEINRTSNTLDKQSSDLENIVSRISANTVKKYGKTAPEGKIISFFNEVSYKNLNSNNTNGQTIGSGRNFKELLQNIANNTNIYSLTDQSRINNFENYETIDEMIPECHLACETYVSNILSPDDFTKDIFNYKYALDSATEDEKKYVTRTIDRIIERYDLNNLVQKIVSKVTTLGEYYIAVLPYDEEFAKMLNATKDNKTGIAGMLTESMSGTLLESIDLNINDETILTEDYANSKLLQDYLDIKSDNKNINSILKEEKQAIINCVNNNVIIGNSADLLKEAASAYADFGKYVKSDSDIDIDKVNKNNNNKVGKNKSVFDTPEMFMLNGSAIRELEPKRIIPLEIDKVCYGYFYIEYQDQNDEHNGSVVNLYANSANTLNGSGGYATMRSDNNVGTGEVTPGAQTLGTTDEMFMFITKVFINAIANKIDKKVINDNKEFKDLIYQLVKMDYIRKKQIKITYFTPDEVVQFKDESIHKNIVFFAKLYIAVLTNDIIIKLGKAHDHRVFYVRVGADKNTSQVVQSTIRDIKTKQYTYGNLSTFSTILSNSPGIGDDYFIPVGPNGERAVDIDMMQGMQDNINNEFLEFLKNAIINGEGIPTALVSDMQQNIEFARNVSQQNLQFARKIVRRQSNLEPSFNKLIRLLFVNETKNTADTRSRKDKNGNIELSIPSKILPKYIQVSFPSPMSLNMTNLLEQSTNVGQLADFIIDTIDPSLQDGSNGDKRNILRGEIVKDLMPSINWDKYQKISDNFAQEKMNKVILKTDRKNKVAQKKNPDTSGFGGQTF